MELWKLLLFRQCTCERMRGFRRWATELMIPREAEGGNADGEWEGGVLWAKSKSCGGCHLRRRIALRPDVTVRQPAAGSCQARTNDMHPSSIPRHHARDALGIGTPMSPCPGNICLSRLLDKSCPCHGRLCTQFFQKPSSVSTSCGIHLPFLIPSLHIIHRQS